MSESPILEYWPEGIAAARIPANNNVRLLQALLLNPAISATTAAQPGSPAELDTYILPASPAGAQWSGFNEDDVVIFYNDTWTAYAPPEGLLKYVEDEGEEWQFVGGSSGGWAAFSGGGGGGSARDTVTPLATSGSVGVDFALGDYFTLALAGNVSGFTFSNLPGSGKGGSLLIRIIQDSTPRTVAWPASFKWAGASPGVVSTVAGTVDLLGISTHDNGATWQATLQKAYA